MTARGGAWRWPLAGALVALFLHLLLGLAGRAAVVRSGSRVDDAVAAIGVHLALFHLRLAAAVAVAGAGAASLGALLLRACGVGRTTVRVAAIAAVLLLAQAARAVAHAPALFDSFLWNRGGARASIERVLAETIGETNLDRGLLVLLLALTLALVLRELEARHWRTLAVCVVLLIGAAAGRWGWRRLPRARPPCIVVLAADSLRPDHFSSEGYPRPTTPVLDALRARALWVDDEFVPIASTTASWASLLTGVYPHTHGVRDLFPRLEATRIGLPTLPRLLHAAGYTTAVVSDYAGESFRRIDFGFDRIDVPPATSLEVFAEREALQRLPLALALFAGRWGRLLFPVADYLPVNSDPALLSDRAFAQLDRLEREGAPFLLVVFYSATHAPFAPPMPFARRFGNPAYRGANRYAYEVQQLDDLARASLRPPREDVEAIRALYDGALLAFDTEVGRSIARLDADGLGDRVLIVTGDHGENLFEPGTTTEHGKWFVGGEAANRTALLLQAPGLEPRRVRGLVSGVDFAPTVLEAVRLPVPPTMEGRSFLHGDPPAERPVFAETALWLGGPSSAPPGSRGYPPLLDLLEVEPGSHAPVLKPRWVDETVEAKLRAVREGRWELVLTPTAGDPRIALFDLATDPFGRSDVGARSPQVRDRLHGELLDWMARDPLRWLDAQDRTVFRTER